MIYTALGDSITFGQDASGSCKTYPSRVIAMLQKRSSTPVSGVILAQPGWTSTALYGCLGQGIERIRCSDTVSIWVGGNDLGFSAVRGAVREEEIEGVLLRYGRNLHGVVGAIQRVCDARIVLCTQYNPFPNSALAERGVGALNAITADTAKRFKADLAPVHKWFHGKEASLIAGYQKGRIEDAIRGPRPIHPNDRGHAVIAEGLVGYIRSKS